jgi:dTDP-glucose 4,6-dehydratase
LLAVLRRGKAGEKYNIGGGTELSNLRMVEALCAALEELLPAAQNPALRARGITSYPALRVFVPDRPGHDRRYATDSSRIRHDTGWQPECPFEDGIRRTARWYLENTQWCESVLAGRFGPGRPGTAGAPEN